MNKAHRTNNMTDTRDTNDSHEAPSALNEQQLLLISDLADGHLQGEKFANAMSLLNNSSHARAVWHRLHVVGDVLRSKELVVCQNDSAFIQRIKLSLQQEPALEPIRVNTLHIKNVTTSANDGVFLWKSVAGLAALVGVMAVSWSLLSGTIQGDGLVAEIASGSAQMNRPPVTVVASDMAVASTSTGRGDMLRDPQLDAMIAAHKQLGGYSALQAPSGFLRHATFDKNQP